METNDLKVLMEELSKRHPVELWKFLNGDYPLNRKTGRQYEKFIRAMRNVESHIEHEELVGS